MQMRSLASYNRIPKIAGTSKTPAIPQPLKRNDVGNPSQKKPPDPVLKLSFPSTSQKVQTLKKPSGATNDP